MQPQYPPQQYGPPPGYAQTYPPQQAPQYPPQQAYPQQAPPAPGYGGAHPQGVPQFHPPAPPQASIVRPRMLDFAREGRLVLVSPTKIERDLPDNLGKPGDKTDRMTADVVILDGPPFPFGGAPEKNRPHTHTAVIPYEILGMFISSAGLISQCERRLGEMVLGRLVMRDLPNGNTAYRINDPTPADEAIAQQYIVDKVAGKIAPPQQIEATQPVAPAGVYGANPSPQAQQAYAQGGPVPQQAYMTQPATLPQYAPAQAPQQWAAPPAQQLDIDTPPVGADPNWWAAQPPEVRQMIAAQAATRPGV